MAMGKLAAERFVPSGQAQLLNTDAAVRAGPVTIVIDDDCDAEGAPAPSCVDHRSHAALLGGQPHNVQPSAQHVARAGPPAHATTGQAVGQGGTAGWGWSKRAWPSTGTGAAASTKPRAEAGATGTARITARTAPAAAITTASAAAGEGAAATLG